MRLGSSDQKFTSGVRVSQTTFSIFEASHVVLISHFPHIKVMNLYATTSGSRVYHLVEGRGSYSLCGLRVTRLDGATQAKGGLLSLVSEKPENRDLCKHCQRLKETDPDADRL